MNKITTLCLFALVSMFIAVESCSKTSADPPATNPCAGKTITVTGTTTPASTPIATNGAISVTGAGSTGFTYSLNAGASQASGSFSGLAQGTYTITAKDAAGCTGSQSFTVSIASCPTINASAATTTTVKCETGSGTVTITATGSTGLTYNINGGTFQASNVFNTLGAANYTYGVKDANGCTTTGTATVAQAAAGPLFINVKSIMVANCTSCHGGSSPQSGINLSDDCTIVAQSARIKARGVDASPSQMPPSGSGLSAANKSAIVNWINAGGKHNN